MKTVVTFRLLIEATKEQPAQLEVAMRQTLEMAVKSMKVYRLRTLGKEAFLGKPTKEESIRLTPRKKHFGGDGYALCVSDIFKRIAVGRTTQNWTAVTCKKCLKKRPASAQKELFACTADGLA